MSRYCLARRFSLRFQKGDVKLLGWVGDETPFQLGVIVTGTRTADGRNEIVQRFLRALRKGAKDYHDAFTDGREQRADQAGAAAASEIIAKNVSQPAELVAKSIAYIDPELKLDEKDIRRQSAWFQQQGMVKGKVAIDFLRSTLATLVHCLSNPFYAFDPYETLRFGEAHRRARGATSRAHTMRRSTTGLTV